MNNVSYFFDTYAFIEILKGNESYRKYIGAEIVTTKLNIFELYFKIIKEKNEKVADEVFDKYFLFAKDFDEEVIKLAVKLKIEINKRDVSMTDCIGYVMAKQYDIKFLTGDDAFKDLDNVEFVK